MLELSRMDAFSLPPDTFVVVVVVRVLLCSLLCFKQFEFLVSLTPGL